MVGWDGQRSRVTTAHRKKHSLTRPQKQNKKTRQDPHLGTAAASLAVQDARHAWEVAGVGEAGDVHRRGGGGGGSCNWRRGRRCCTFGGGTVEEVPRCKRLRGHCREKMYRGRRREEKRRGLVQMRDFFKTRQSSWLGGMSLVTPPKKGYSTPQAPPDALFQSSRRYEKVSESSVQVDNQQSMTKRRKAHGTTQSVFRD